MTAQSDTMHHTCCMCHKTQVERLGEVCEPCMDDIPTGYVEDDVIGGILTPPIDD